MGKKNWREMTNTPSIAKVRQSTPKKGGKGKKKGDFGGWHRNVNSR